MELEGLRGVAAVVVVIYHAMIMFYPGIAYGQNPSLAPVQNMRFEDNLYGNPINVFLSGGFAVAIFFVLSGFVLSIGYFKAGKESIIKKLAIKRYVRLMIPALGSVLLAYVLIALGFSSNKQAAVDITHSGHLDHIWQLSPSLIDAFKEGVISVFMQSGSGYNGVLWTMHYEFVGSFIVFAALLVFGSSPYRALGYAALLMWSYGTWFMAIILGMVLADIYAQGYLEKVKSKTIAMYALLVTGLVAGGYPILSPDGTFYERLRIAALSDEQNTIVYLSFGALMVILAVLNIQRITEFFASRRISLLGKYTYSLYLTHTPVLYTLGVSFFVFLAQYMGMNKAAVISMGLTLPFIAISAWIYEKYVDMPSIKISNIFADLIMEDRPLTRKAGLGKVRRIARLALVKMRESKPVALLIGD